ncbi:hypothetical protein VMCG_05103 [Cytospora schulzeri]|uniref:Piwi domain-containing protein n=1 Tax=Cytospora schulzeri TaxID=448051 RepID=A0A423WMD4_9PEZI|nr:hypothetical protein VMCG_05103 [Valsa malicola]
MSFAGFDGPSGAQAIDPGQNKPPRGGKLKALIRDLLQQLGQPCASDFQLQLVSPEKLRLKNDGCYTCNHTHQGRTEVWAVDVHNYVLVDVDSLITLLSGPSPRRLEEFGEEIKTVGTILGHSVRDSNNVVGVGKARYFATGKIQGTNPAIGRQSWELDPADRDKVTVDVLRGFFHSVRPATGQLLLNVNVTYGVFWARASLHVILKRKGLVNVSKSWDMDKSRQQDYIDGHRWVKGVRVEYTTPSGTFVKKVAGFATSLDGENQPLKPRFRITMPDKYGANSPHVQGINTKLPLINIGSRLKPIYVFAERCRIVDDQPTKCKLSSVEQAQMVKNAVQSAFNYRDHILKSGRALLGLNNQAQWLRSLKVEVGSNLIQVRGRHLDPPPRLYKSIGSRQNAPEKGVGKWDLRNRRVWSSAPEAVVWTILNFEDNRRGSSALIQRAKKFIHHLIDTMGINLKRDPSMSKEGEGYQRLPVRNIAKTFGNRFKNFASLKPSPIIFVILPGDNAARYNVIKQVADVHLGFHTVCVQEEKFMREKGELQYFANVGLKVNLKIGGTNHKLDKQIGKLNFAETMIVGYDVIHPTNLPPSKDGEDDDGDDGTKKKQQNSAPPSLVGIVASRDGSLGQWPAHAWNNPSGKEQVQDSEFQAAFRGRLKIWHTHNQRKLPKNIIIFRDGVSESQYQKVLDEELPWIRKEFEEALVFTGNAFPMPRITVLVAIKRHQTRFYPSSKNQFPRDKTPPGTVVDRDVTHGHSWDFYLQAHEAIQGTARPAHYVVLHEVIIPDHGRQDAARVLEDLTHSLSYMFGRATRSVSLCTPAYYADIVCTRAKLHKLELFESHERLTQNDKDNIKNRVVHENIADTMYYI